MLMVAAIAWLYTKRSGGSTLSGNPGVRRSAVWVYHQNGGNLREQCGVVSSQISYGVSREVISRTVQLENGDFLLNLRFVSP
ncbi:hypothetical protein DPEC_G00003330 [Dallia pectoralis]|uniref:Uncharacterized protein n=1 Tax=Dallia pectoralis TaxID=75939 RepID=A0ACC2HK65_DALPE|nr:hypothetical protein DPEC_G00003330 [Dallia pectoralis]